MNDLVKGLLTKARRSRAKVAAAAKKATVTGAQAMAELVEELRARITGKRLCELKRTGETRPKDLFLVSQLDVGQEQYVSRAIDYGQVVSCLADDFEGSLGLGTMAYEEKWEYSKVDHQHEGRYTKVAVTEACPSGESLCCLAVVSVGLPGAEALDGCSQYRLMCPNIQMPDPPEPEIGTLRFVYARSAMAAVADINADDFDGWVYPDGSTYQVDDTQRFSKALAVFGSGRNAITVPDVGGFFKAVGSSVSSFARVPARYGVAKHSHQVDSVRLSGDLKVKDGFKFDTYTNKTEGVQKGMFVNQVHWGAATETPGVADIGFNIDLSQVQFQGLSCQYEGQESGSYAPKHVTMPVMIYVGGVVSYEYDETTYDLELARVSTPPDAQYTGDPIEPSLTVRMGKKYLKRGEDYELLYFDNVNVGTATVEVSALGEYYNSVYRNFSITPVDIGEAEGEITGGIG